MCSIGNYSAKKWGRNNFSNLNVFDKIKKVLDKYRKNYYKLNKLTKKNIIMNNEEKFLRVLDIISKKATAFKLKELEKIESVDLNLKDFQYIDVIRKLMNPSFTDIANELNLTKPSVTAIINKLEQQKLIFKERSHNDKRMFFIYLTSKGKKISEAYQRGHQQLVKHIHSSLSEDEFAKLVELFDKTV